MKSKLSLSSPLWDTPKRRARLSAVIQLAGLELERDIKTTISSSKPAGRTYRRTRIVRNPSKSRPSGLRKYATAGGKTKVIVGYNFHRASRRGQAPAIDTGRLINSIRMQKVSQLRVKVATSVLYAPILDDPAGLDRPFFESTVKANRTKYLKRIRREMLKKI